MPLLDQNKVISSITRGVCADCKHAKSRPYGYWECMKLPGLEYRVNLTAHRTCLFFEPREEAPPAGE